MAGVALDDSNHWRMNFFVVLASGSDLASPTLLGSNDRYQWHDPARAERRSNECWGTPFDRIFGLRKSGL
jgi:hypothetical protein